MKRDGEIVPLLCRASRGEIIWTMEAGGAALTANDSFTVVFPKAKVGTPLTTRAVWMRGTREKEQSERGTNREIKKTNE